MPAKLKAHISKTSGARIKLTLQNYRIENKQLKNELQILREEIATTALPIPSDLNNDFMSIMSTADHSKMPPFMKFFWEEQQRYLSTSKHGIRYHPIIIRYCLSLAAKSPAAYDDKRYNEQTGTGFVVLPSRRRLRDYKNYIHTKTTYVLSVGLIRTLSWN